MSLTVTYLDTAKVESFAKEAIITTGLPNPRAITVLEDKSYDDEDVFIVRLHVHDDDDLGTAEQRVTTAGRIQRLVWDSGDPRTVFLRHQLVPSHLDEG